MNILKFRHRSELREWIASHHTTEKECWVACKRGSGNAHKGMLSYLDVVEEAPCFGWIDSTVKTANGVSVQRISPRRKNSGWTELNKERARRLERMGLMTDLERKALPDMDIEHFKIDDDILAVLKADESVWNNFQNFPPLYSRIRTDTIQRKRNTKLFDKRLEKFVEYTRKNIMYGQWNDDGRLL